MIIQATKRKLIEKVIGELLFSYGFSFWADNRMGHYFFERRKNDVTQTIEIIDEKESNNGNFRFYTTKSRQETVTYFLRSSGVDLKEWQCSDVHNGWNYTDKESFVQMLMLF